MAIYESFKFNDHSLNRLLDTMDNHMNSGDVKIFQGVMGKVKVVSTNIISTDKSGYVGVITYSLEPL